MGLLKHVLLPGFGLLHAVAAYACSDLQGWGKMVGLKEDTVDKDTSENSLLRQNHMLGALRGFNIAMMLLCGTGVLKESAHFRGQVLLAEATLFGVTTIDAFRLGTLNYWVPLAQTVIATAGVIINGMEPGIFTKDKNA